MSGLKTDIQKDANHLTLTLRGELTEDLQLPSADLKGVNKLFIDTGELTYINSLGMRNWIYWTAELKQKVNAVVFQRLSNALVRQMVQLGSLLPEECKVSSVYVPLYCDACDRAEVKLFDFTKDLSSGLELSEVAKVLNHVPCPSCAAQMEVDGNPEAYAKLIEKLAKAFHKPFTQQAA